MDFRVVEPPAPVVSLDEAKQHLIVDYPDDDLLIETYIQAATAWLDGPTGWLGQVLGEQVLEIVSEHDPLCLPSLLQPVTDIVQVSFTDERGVEQIVDPETYQLGGDKLWLWPLSPLRHATNSRIRFKAGYPVVNGKSTVPPSIRVAILMLVGHWYQNRSAVVIGNTVADVPFTVEALLGPYRVYR